MMADRTVGVCSLVVLVQTIKSLKALKILKNMYF